MANLTEQEYVDRLGLACPNCHSTEGVDTLEAPLVDDGIAWQKIECNLCLSSWVDNYTLVGYSEFKIGIPSALLERGVELGDEE